MVHVFNRESETETLREAFTEYGADSYEIQMSYNNYGHLVIRFFKRDEDGNVEDEFMIVFSESESQELIGFINTHIKNV